MAAPGRQREEAALLLAALEVGGRAEWEQLSGTPLAPSTFARPNTRALEASLCLFYTLISGRAKAKKELRNCWPVSEPGQAKEFRALMHGWVKALAAGGSVPADAAKHFMVAYQTASGPRTVELLACLAPLALRAKLGGGSGRLEGDVAATAPDLLDDGAVTGDWEAELARAQGRRQAEAQRVARAVAVLTRLRVLGASAAGGAAGDARRLQQLQRVLGAGLDLGLDPSLRLDELSCAGSSAAEGEDSSAAPPAAVIKCLMRALQRGLEELRRRQAEGAAAGQDLLQLLSSQSHALCCLTEELRRAVSQQQKATGAGSSGAGGTPRSVLELLPPSPPRSNPLGEAAFAAEAAGRRQAGLYPSAEGAATEAAAEAAAVRREVWSSVHRRASQSNTESAASAGVHPSPAPRSPSKENVIPQRGPLSLDGSDGAAAKPASPCIAESIASFSLHPGSAYEQQLAAAPEAAARHSPAGSAAASVMPGRLGQASPVAGAAEHPLLQAAWQEDDPECGLSPAAATPQSRVHSYSRAAASPLGDSPLGASSMQITPPRSLAMTPCAGSPSAQEEAGQRGGARTPYAVTAEPSRRVSASDACSFQPPRLLDTPTSQLPARGPSPAAEPDVQGEVASHRWPAAAPAASALAGGGGDDAMQKLMQRFSRITTAKRE